MENQEKIIRITQWGGKPELKELSKFECGIKEYANKCKCGIIYIYTVDVGILLSKGIMLCSCGENVNDAEYIYPLCKNESKFPYITGTTENGEPRLDDRFYEHPELRLDQHPIDKIIADKTGVDTYIPKDLTH